MNLKNFFRIFIIALFAGELSHAAPALITSVKQIDPGVRSDLVNTAPAFQAVQSSVATNSSNIASLTGSVNNLNTNAFLVTGGTVTGPLTYTYGVPGLGKTLMSDANGLATWQTPTGIALLSDTQTFTGQNTFTNTTTINAPLIYTDGNQAAGKILTSDANGDATWQAPIGGGGSYVLLSSFTVSIATGVIDLGNIIDAPHYHSFAFQYDIFLSSTPAQTNVTGNISIGGTSTIQTLTAPNLDGITTEITGMDIFFILPSTFATWMTTVNSIPGGAQLWKIISTQQLDGIPSPCDFYTTGFISSPVYPLDFTFALDMTAGLDEIASGSTMAIYGIK